ncbi:2OG-Fe dioxygenase family protein [Nocardia cyriacigeorgica]|uniref:2OG-Fe dioxygenase family protein n=1 Tax=Nocardia cyriacigeorgica TaxID=135487 RepID=UPI001485DC37|nr:2OG-Fe dioxygenase family protein [Nocardia cyriacigeorgica]
MRVQQSVPSEDTRSWLMTAADFRLDADALAVLRETFDRDTALDTWLPADRRYRHRAYQCFRLDVGADLAFTAIDEPLSYFQSVEVNAIAGGIERKFAQIGAAHPVTPITARIARTVARGLLAAGVLDADKTPHCLVDAHYMRIIAPGEPAPEGVHRDGLLAGSAHLIGRSNIAGGLSSIFDAGTRDEIGRFELTDPMDSYVFDDEQVLHYTSPVEPEQPERPAYRDVLLTGFRPA